MAKGAAQRISNGLLPLAAGLASFLFSFAALLLLTEFNAKMVASIALGAFCLLICWIAAERPNSETARAGTALVERIIAGENGDLTSPTPAIVHRALPAVGQAIDHLFSQVRASIDNAHAIALFDPVTSLPNRVHFREQADALIAVRHPDAISAMMFVDLDRFKAINDNLGHARGDEALMMVASRLRAVAISESGDDGAPQPLVARLAGDEFTMFFPALETPADAGRIARRVLFALSQPFEIRGQSLDIGASIGVALCPRHGCELGALMRASDIAMYEAKASGRGQVCVFDDTLSFEFETRAATEAGIKAALKNEEFELFFQPQVHAVGGELVAVEALLRWRHPISGLRLPASFVSVAEGCGLIGELGDWVIRAVAETLTRWDRLGVATPISFNVSPRQLDRSQFFTRLREAMEHAGAKLSRLELELTETAAPDLSPTTLEGIAALRADGVTIALDDFGSGFSNLARLKKMPLDRIKIDDSVVADIERSENSRVIAQAIVQLIHGLGCSAVAEGVESKAQADVLRLIGCEALQGFALGEPMAESAMLDWIANLAPHQIAGSMRTIKSA